MEVTNSLLVALMFVTLLSIGIGTIVGSLSALVDERVDVALDWIPVSWIILLLLAHFNLFWHTLVLLERDEWGFIGFLYVLAGPVMLFLAANLMLPDPGNPAARDLRAQYFNVARRFFAIMALLMVWMMGVDLVLGKGFTMAGAGNAGVAVLFAAMASSQDERLHAAGTGVTWALFVAILVLRGVGATA